VDPPATPPEPDVATEIASGRSLLSGGLWNGVNQLLPQLYTLIQSVVAARVLGPSEMGHQSFIAWVSISVKTLVTGGVPVALMRYVGESVGRGRPGSARVLVRWSLRIEIAGASLGGLIIIGIGLHNGRLQNAWFLAAVVCILTSLHTIPYGVLVGVQRWRQAAIIGLTLGALSTIGTVGALLAGAGVTGMFAVEALIAAASLVWTSGAAQRAYAQFGDGSAAEPSLQREFSRYAAVASVLVVFEVIVWKRSEFFFLDRYSTAAELAQYSVAFAAATAISRLPQGMASVLSPAMASMFGAGEFERVRVGFSRAVRLVATASLPIAAGSVAAGPALLDVVYGDQYRKAGTVIVVLMLAFPFVPLASLGTSVVHGYGRVRLALTAIAFAAVIDVGLAAALVPKMGASGAAIANAGGQLVAGILLLYFAARLAGPLDLAPATLLRAALASAVAGAVSWAAVHGAGGVLGIVLAAVGGTGTFAVLLVALRGVVTSDAEWIRDNAGDRFGGAIGVAAARFLREP